MNTKALIGKTIRIGVIVGSLTCAMGFTSIATAAQGCGKGFHRNHNGHCVKNHHYRHYYHYCWYNFWGQVRCR